MATVVFATSARPALADSASWAYAGGGGSNFQGPRRTVDTAGLLQLEAGMGTSPNHLLVLGGVFKTLTHFGGGTDLVLCQRTTTSGFSMGDWGAALDLGGYLRAWGDDSAGLSAALVGSAPWGVNLNLIGTYGNHDAKMVALTIGVDWARLTAHRVSSSTAAPNYRLPLDDEYWPELQQ